MVQSPVGNGLSLASTSPENRPEQVEIGQIDNACLFNFISFFRKGSSPERLLAISVFLQFPCNALY
jgi:hypothetical protein